MIKSGDVFGGLSAQQGKWRKIIQTLARMRSTEPGQVPPSSHLTETVNFGANPGALRMFKYLPPGVSDNSALVVVLHGCMQSAATYDLGAGWSTLAERYGFALLLPEQQRSNNPNGCFNWFQKGDIERGHGEALSIRQMVAKMVSDHGIDPARVFVTGLSAGGAMTSAMLATYPDTFAGGATIAGLPYGAASNVQQAFENMFQCPPRTARAWGDLVRAASSHNGPWPRVSVWHGGSDATVVPTNAAETVKQWTNVHGLPATASARSIVDGYPREVWLNDSGDEVIESYTIPNMAHGVPLATGEADDECGAAGPFLLEVGISSSYHIAKFFGLTTTTIRPEVSTRNEIVRLDQSHVSEPTAALDVLEGEVLNPGEDDPMNPGEAGPNVPTSPFPEIGAVIANALKAAGLMRRQ